MATIFGTPDDTATIITAKTANKTSYSPGETITYTITVANMGPATAVSPVVKDEVPSIVQNPQFSIDSGTTWNPWGGSLQLPDLKSGDAFIILIRGTVAIGATGSLNNIATTTTPTPRPFGVTGAPGVSTGTTSTGSQEPTPGVMDSNQNPVVKPEAAGATGVTGATGPGQNPTANVLTVKSSDKTSYSPGESITYNIVVGNLGPATAKAPMLRDPVPPAVLNPRYTDDLGATWQPWNGSLQLPDIPAAFGGYVRIRGTVATGSSGSLNNTATTTTPTPSPYGPTGSPGVSTGTTATGPTGISGATGSNQNPYIMSAANITTAKKTDKFSYKPGEPITYTITVSNSGPATASAPRVTDMVPAQVENPMFSVDGGPPAPWTGKVTLPDMPSGKVTVIHIVGTIREGASGSLANSATTMTPTPSKNGSPNVSTGQTPGDPIVAESADLVTRKEPDKKSYLPGETITYTITVYNSGPSAAAIAPA